MNNIKQRQHEAKMTLLKAIMRSKTILSFGYQAYSNYFTKMFLFRLFKCFRCCCGCFKCCQVAKHSSMTARKYHRANNAYTKMAEEIDLLSIIKTLRRARFLINQRMDWKQQQLVDYFKEYSLETPTIHQQDHKVYSKKELIEFITSHPKGKSEDYLMFHKQI